MKDSGNRVFSRTARAIDGLTEVTGYICGLFILVAALVIFEAVFVRKVLGQSTTWQSELSVYLLMASAFIGAAFTQKYEKHIGVDLVTTHLSDRVRPIIDIAGKVIGLIIAVVIAILGWDMWWEAVKANEHSETLWGPHLGFPYIIIPLGMSLLALQYIVRIGYKVAQFRAQGVPQAAPLGVAKKEGA